MEQFLETLYKLVIFPLLPVLVAYLIALLRKKTAELAVKTDSATVEKYLYMINDTITMCVTATNQTFVESLKKTGKFDEVAHKQAFVATYNNVISLLNEEVLNYIEEATGDVEKYLTEKIEAEVNVQK